MIIDKEDFHACDSKKFIKEAEDETGSLLHEVKSTDDNNSS